MAEAVGMASGVLALAAFAFQSSKTLYEAFRSFQTHGRRIDQLKTELEALTGVLESLCLTLESNPEGLDGLKLPLLHCGKACQECQQMVAKCSSHSDGSRTSLRDWFKFNFMGKDITGFTTLICGYKATIMVALGDANLRTSKVTVELLRQYKDMISSTTFDLEEILQDLDAAMRDPRYQDVADLGERVGQLRLAADEERESIQQCLKICMEVSHHIDQVQVKSLSPPLPTTTTTTTTTTTALTDPSPETPRGRSPSSLAPAPDIPRMITSRSLTDCQRGIGYTAVQLRARLQDLNRQIAAINSASTSETGTAAHAKLEEMKEVADSVKQCLSICGEAAEQASAERVNVFEDIKMGDEGHQIILSTIGDLIYAKRVTVGSRSAQWLGQMSDSSLQQLSKNYNVGTVISSQGDVEQGTHFENKHGVGRTVGKEQKTG